MLGKSKSIPHSFIHQKPNEAQKNRHSRQKLGGFEGSIGKSHSSSCTCPFSSSRQLLIIYRKLGCFANLVEIFHRRYFINMKKRICLLSLLAINLQMLSCRASEREITCARIQEFQGIMDLGLAYQRTQKENEAELSKVPASSARDATV